MKQIRFLTISIACLMLLASPSFGATKSREFIVENRNALDAYCAYAYINTDRGNPEYHVDGWERIPSGTAVPINYTSEYSNLHICLILADGGLWSSHSDPSGILGLNVSKELETSFKVVYEMQGAKIIGNIAYNHTSVDEKDLEIQTFYKVDATNIIIPGPKDITDQLPVDDSPGRSKPIDKTDTEPNPDPFNGNYERDGQDYAVLFATNEYTDKVWNDLKHPISQAKQIRTALQKYGFTVELHEDVTTRNIGNVLKKWELKTYAPDDQLLVYFAGHGHYDNLDGYLAGKDSLGPDLDPDYTSYYPYKRLKERLDAIPCPNILLMVDADYGGMLDPQVQRKAREKYEEYRNIGRTRGSGNLSPEAEKEYREMYGRPRGMQDTYKGPNKQRRIKETVNAKTRWFLTAGGNEAIPDDSIFAKAFLKALEDTLSDKSDKDNVLINDKVLTIQEIEAMFRNMLDKQNHKYSPTTGAFGDNKDDRGFLFIDPSPNFGAKTVPGPKDITDQLPVDDSPGRSKPVDKTDTEPETDPFNGNYEREGQDYAILFATNEYEDVVWPDLKHPISDAKQIRTALQKYGFTVELYPNVPLEDIGNVLRRWKEKVYAPDDQLLVYFAGHGYYDNLDGYLAGKDSLGPDLDAGFTSYYSYQMLKKRLDAIPCPNILLMIDACHSGNISSEVQKKLGEYRSLPDLYRGPNKQRRIKETVNAKTRWFLTAVGNEESRADSIFAKAFLKSLEDTLSGNSDKDNVLINDKILTIQEIEAMFRNMLDKQNLKFSPTTGAFGDNKDDRGFLFIGP